MLKLNEAIMDYEIASHKMSKEEKDNKVIILCNDCLNKSIVSDHPFGFKCIKCRSYNTRKLRDYDHKIDNKLNKI